jgi:hypothetical protein
MPGPGASDGWVIRVTPGGRLEWVAPEPPADQVAARAAAPADAKRRLGEEVISAEEHALVEANREKIAELRTRVYPSPDLHDLIADIMARSNPPTLSLAVAAWILQATGLVPTPVMESAAVTLGAVGFVGREVRHRVHAEQVPEEATQGANRLWQNHPGLAMQILTTVMGTVIDSIKNAIRVDDRELEDELDAFYPRWSRTDFEFDLRCYQR